MFRFLSNLWYSIYNYVSVLYPDTWVNEKGHRQLMTLDYANFINNTSIPIAKKYYKPDGKYKYLHGIFIMD
jgi:hypothetical protein